MLFVAIFFLGIALLAEGTSGDEWVDIDPFGAADLSSASEADASFDETAEGINLFPDELRGDEGVETLTVTVTTKAMDRGPENKTGPSQNKISAMNKATEIRTAEDPEEPAESYIENSDAKGPFDSSSDTAPETGSPSAKSGVGGSTAPKRGDDDEHHVASALYGRGRKTNRRASTEKPPQQPSRSESTVDNNRASTEKPPQQASRSATEKPPQQPSRSDSTVDTADTTHTPPRGHDRAERPPASSGNTEESVTYGVRADTRTRTAEYKTTTTTMASTTLPKTRSYEPSTDGLRQDQRNAERPSPNTPAPIAPTQSTETKLPDASFVDTTAPVKKPRRHPSKNSSYDSGFVHSMRKNIKRATLAMWSHAHRSVFVLHTVLHPTASSAERQLWITLERTVILMDTATSKAKNVFSRMYDGVHPEYRPYIISLAAFSLVYLAAWYVCSGMSERQQMQRLVCLMEKCTEDSDWAATGWKRVYQSIAHIRQGHDKIAEQLSDMETRINSISKPTEGMTGSDGGTFAIGMPQERPTGQQMAELMISRLDNLDSLMRRAISNQRRSPARPSSTVAAEHGPPPLEESNSQSELGRANIALDGTVGDIQALSAKVHRMHAHNAQHLAQIITCWDAFWESFHSFGVPTLLREIARDRGIEYKEPDLKSIVARNSSIWRRGARDESYAVEESSTIRQANTNFTDSPPMEPLTDPSTTTFLDSSGRAFNETQPPRQGSDPRDWGGGFPTLLAKSGSASQRPETNQNLGNGSFPPVDANEDHSAYLPSFHHSVDSTYINDNIQSQSSPMSAPEGMPSAPVVPHTMQRGGVNVFLNPSMQHPENPQNVQTGPYGKPVQPPAPPEHDAASGGGLLWGEPPVEGNPIDWIQEQPVYSGVGPTQAFDPFENANQNTGQWMC